MLVAVPAYRTLLLVHAERPTPPLATVSGTEKVTVFETVRFAALMFETERVEFALLNVRFADCPTALVSKP